MIDHLAAFPDEAAARAALPSFCAQGKDGSWRWDASRVVPGLSVIMADAVWDHSVPMRPVLTSPEVVLPGFWIAIALPELDTALRDLPGDVCKVITNRSAAHSGVPREQFTLYVSPSVDPAVLATGRVAPVFAGSAYPFGS